MLHFYSVPSCLYNFCKYAFLSCPIVFLTKLQLHSICQCHPHKRRTLYY
uniref:Uncharacterized protein n=1 Tax=Setaria italica TaxID=4555 RepID=K4APJ9_SETIT